MSAVDFATSVRSRRPSRVTHALLACAALLLGACAAVPRTASGRRPPQCGEDVYVDDEPETSTWERWLPRMLEPVVPEELL